MDKKNILVVNNQMQLGGVCIAAKNFIENMQDEFDLEFVLTKRSGELENRLPQNIPVSYVPYPLCCAAMTRKESKPFGKKYYIRKCITGLLLKFFPAKFVGYGLVKKTPHNNKHYDMVINNDMDMDFWYPGPCHLYTRHLVDASVKCLIIHGDFIANGYDIKFFKKEYLPNYDYIILLSNALKEQLEQIYPEYSEKFVVIPNFQADKEIIDLSTAFDVKFEKDVLNFVSASRLTELKGIMRSLRVLKKLKDEGYQFVWHILGDGEQKEEIKNYIKENNMESCVILHGLQKNPYPFIKAADFLYLGSYHESYGLVLIESMLLGRPVLTTKTISAEEIVDKSYGWVCDNTEDGIYDGFKSIFENVKAVETKTQNLIGYTFNNQAIKEKYKELFRS